MKELLVKYRSYIPTESDDIYIDRKGRRVILSEANTWKDITSLFDYFIHNDVQKIVIIMHGTLSVQQKNMCKLLHSVEVISDKLVNPFSHPLQPTILFYNGYKKEKIPIILKSDPVSIFFGLDEGDVIQIIRDNSVYYRRCQGTDNVFFPPKAQIKTYHLPANIPDYRSRVIKGDPALLFKKYPKVVSFVGGSVTCPRCQSNMTRIIPIQNRRADEMTNIFRQCLQSNCQYLWKI